MIWQILIPTIPHRHAKLVALLDVLEPQMRRGVEVLIYSNNLEVGYRDKVQYLQDVARAQYTSFLADDDSVAPDFIPKCLAAMKAEKPDYIGYRVRYTEAGVLQPQVTHSLAVGGWIDGPGGYGRDLMYYNPIKRTLANKVRFRGESCDVEWAEDLRALGIVKTEVFIDEELLYYQRDPNDNFHTGRMPMLLENQEPLPERPFVRYVAPVLA